MGVFVFFKGNWTMHFSSYCSNNLQVKEYIKESIVDYTLNSIPSIPPKNLIRC